MLQVNVGVSRKLTENYNSQGFSINVVGEVPLTLDDPERVLQKIQEYYDLAEEAINDQIERYQSDAAIASRDQPGYPSGNETPREPVIPPPRIENRGQENPPANGNGNGYSRSGSNNQQATHKQIRFLLQLGRERGFDKRQLEQEIEQLIGERRNLYDLTKAQAGQVIEYLTSQPQQRSR